MQVLCLLVIIVLSYFVDRTSSFRRYILWHYHYSEVLRNICLAKGVRKTLLLLSIVATDIVYR